MSYNEGQRSANNFGPRILQNPWAVWRHYTITRLLAASVCKNDYDDIATMSQNCPSTEHQQLFTNHLGTSGGSAATLTHNQTIGRVSR